MAEMFLTKYWFVTNGLNQKTLRLNNYVGQIGRCFSSNAKSTHYDTLEINRNASHNQIKSAYYRLSMQHHPDRSSKGAQAAASEKFRQITEAYQVLGNSETRAMYDASVFDQNAGVERSSIERDFQRRAYDFRSLKKKKYTPPPMSGRSAHYNFDEYYRMHYGRNLKRRAELINDWERQEDDLTRHRFSNAMLCVITSIIVLVFVVVNHMNEVTGYNEARKQWDDKKR